MITTATTMQTPTITGLYTDEMLVLNNQIYEYKKGVRSMVLFTCSEGCRRHAVSKLERQGIQYIVKPVGNGCLNIFFGRDECIKAIKMMVTRPLNELTPEEDFILGAMLGYDICVQCERYMQRKSACNCIHLAAV